MSQLRGVFGGLARRVGGLVRTPPPAVRPILAGLATAALSAPLALVTANDFDQLWVAARALARGVDPYAVVAASHVGWDLPLYYPLPAVVLVLPLAWLPLPAARLAFTALCGFVAGAGLWRLRPAGLVALASAPFVASAIKGQFTSALTGASLIPSLGFLLAAKPTVGLSLWLARPTRRAAVVAVAFMVATVALWPSWPGAWLQALHGASHYRPPLVRPGGAILLLALLRWRQPEGRLLAAWACIPHTEALYDLLPLFLAARTATESALLVVLSWLALLVIAMLPGGGSPDPTASWPALLLLLYLPALILVLCRQPSPRRPYAAPAVAGGAP